MTEDTRVPGNMVAVMLLLTVLPTVKSEEIEKVIAQKGQENAVVRIRLSSSPFARRGLNLTWSMMVNWV